MTKIISCISIFILFLSSCSTLKPVPQDPKIYSAAQKIKNACFQTADPNFSAQLSTTRFVPSIHLEAVWKDQYQNLIIQLEDVLGEEYGTIHLKNNSLKIDLIQNEQIQMQDFDPFISFLSSLGSRGVRNLICGNYAFDAQGDASKAFLVLNDHTIKVQSKIDLKTIAEKETIAITSRFLYGIFSNDSDIKVTWIGEIFGDSVTAKSVTFLFKDKDKYLIHFDEYQ